VVTGCGVNDPLARWRRGWKGTRRVVVASAPASLVWPETRAVLEAGGIDVVATTLADAELAEVLISGGTPLDEPVFARLTQARFVLRPYVGYDDIDVEAATRHGILVANTPDVYPEDVANHALALILAANRRIPRMERFVRDGRWAGGGDPWAAAGPVSRLSTLTLGLVGLGRIGQLVAGRANAFGFRLLAADPHVKPETATALDVRLVSLDELLRESDIVSVHALLTRDTRHLLDARRLALMKPTALLVNTARGPVVDEPALVEAIRAGRLAGAALDVFESEPLDAASPLVGLDDVILSPHLGSYSVEGVVLHRRRVGQLARQAATGLPERAVVLNQPLYDRVAALPACAGVLRH
jgi:D-3-phosphoglycerate dehydrogenase